MWQRGGTRKPNRAEALQPEWAMDWEIDGHVLGPPAALGGTPGSSASTVLGRRESALPPCYKVWAPPAVHICLPNRPGLGSHRRAQFCGGRERSCEQGHSMYETPRRPSLWAVEALPTRLVGAALMSFRQVAKGQEETATHIGLHQRASGRPRHAHQEARLRQHRSKIQRVHK